MTGGSERVQRFEFAFAPAYVLPVAAFGITRRTAWVEVDEDDLRARFGLWTLHTPRANVVGVSLARGFAYLKTVGPAHLSFTDHGVTFATNGDRGVCVEFHEPVRALDPTGRLRHPGATFTVGDPDRLVRSLEVR